MKSPSLVLALSFALSMTAFPCFDTLLFLNKKSMVYPKYQMAVEMSGEYSMPDAARPQQDGFSGNLNLYYGLFDRVSIQVGLASSEKERGVPVSVDEYGLRGVFNFVRNAGGFYNLDGILEHRGSFGGSNFSLEASFPSLFHVGPVTFVFHPVLAFASSVDFSVRGHGGVFLRLGEIAVVGLGAEYESAQSSVQFGRRLVEGEAATSLFLGAKLGQHLYLQNEFIKGWGTVEKGMDFGYAFTVKGMIDFNHAR